MQSLPALLDLADLRHVGHGAAGVQIGEDHLLAVAREHVGALRHEMHAAEDDVLRIGFGRGFGKLVRIAGEVRKADHLVALIVVSKQDRRGAQRAACGRNALVIRVVGQDEVVIERASLSIGRDRGNSFFQNTHNTPPSVRFGVPDGLAPIWTGMLKDSPKPGCSRLAAKILAQPTGMLQPLVL